MWVVTFPWKIKKEKKEKSVLKQKILPDQSYLEILFLSVTVPFLLCRNT